MVTPVFDREGKEIIFYTALRGHHRDIGGRDGIPGNSICQKKVLSLSLVSLRLPAKLMKRASQSVSWKTRHYNLAALALTASVTISQT